ncbi:MAG TPA: hypothetical protein VFC19_18900, partial [Candidatus Limnocylindrales bacterium]|nr:hypothetical protein [Candidatus Limnocylindrales bacterium]
PSAALPPPSVRRFAAAVRPPLCRRFAAARAVTAIGEPARRSFAKILVTLAAGSGPETTASVTTILTT